VKFATVATEVRTGHEIWLTHGRIVDAMRASYALPGIFAAVMVGDRWLVDGALVNPVPVSAARAFGAEIVIAANLSSDVFAHSRTIYSHGPTAEVTVAATPEVMDPAPPKRGFGKFFCAERTVKREFFGGAGRPGISTIMVDAFNICRTRSPAHGGRRSAGPFDFAPGRPDRLVRFPPRRRPDRPMARARPSAPSNPFRRRSAFWCRPRRTQARWPTPTRARKNRSDQAVLM
jgi:hypothetical protein